MSATLPGWSPEIERGFKEILFRFLEEIQCTRAALYLFGPGDRFLLATQYGFGRRDVLAIEHGLEAPMVKRVQELKGVPAAYNRKNDLGTLTEYLKSAGNTKLLLVPLIAGDIIIGFIDARDKGRKRTFERTDMAKAKKIAAGDGGVCQTERVHRIRLRGRTRTARDRSASSSDKIRAGADADARRCGSRERPRCGARWDLGARGRCGRGYAGNRRRSRDTHQYERRRHGYRS